MPTPPPCPDWEADLRARLAYGAAKAVAVDFTAEDVRRLLDELDRVRALARVTLHSLIQENQQLRARTYQLSRPGATLQVDAVPMPPLPQRAIEEALAQGSGPD